MSKKKFLLTAQYLREAERVEQLKEGLGEYLKIGVDADTIHPEKKAFFELADNYGLRPNLNDVHDLDESLDITVEDLEDLERECYVEILDDEIDQLEQRIQKMLLSFGMNILSGHIYLDEDYYRGADLTNDSSLQDVKDFLIGQIISYQEE